MPDEPTPIAQTESVDQEQLEAAASPSPSPVPKEMSDDHVPETGDGADEPLMGEKMREPTFQERMNGVRDSFRETYSAYGTSITRRLGREGRAGQGAGGLRRQDDRGVARRR